MKLLECRNAPYGANNSPFLSLRLPGSPCLALWMKGRATKMVKFSFISIYSEGPIYLSLSIQSNKRKDSKNIFIHFPFSIENRLLMKWDEHGEIIFLSSQQEAFAHPVYQFRLSVASSHYGVTYEKRLWKWKLRDEKKNSERWSQWQGFAMREVTKRLLLEKISNRVIERSFFISRSFFNGILRKIEHE